MTELVQFSRWSHNDSITHGNRLTDPVNPSLHIRSAASVAEMFVPFSLFDHTRLVSAPDPGISPEGTRARTRNADSLSLRQPGSTDMQAEVSCENALRGNTAGHRSSSTFHPE
jgi:hypothetical protein